MYKIINASNPMEIKTKIPKKHKGSQKKEFIIAIAILLIINIIASFFYLRLDLTADKRYTLRPITKQILKQANEAVYIKVYLTGELPSGFVRLEHSVKELLEEFKIYQKNIHFEFIDLYKIENEQARNQVIKELLDKGMQPTQLEVKAEGGMTRRLIFPCAEVSVGDKFVAVKILVEQFSRSSEETLNNSVQNIELQFISAIRSLFATQRKSIAILDGHQELEPIRSLSFAYDLTEFYDVKRIRFQNDPGALLAYDTVSKQVVPLFNLLIIAQPKLAFSEDEKYSLDQYVMRGGRILWLLDAASASLDSLRGVDEIMSQYYALNLEDLLFHYGVRVQANMVLDLNGTGVPVVTGYMG
ncbi:MAG: Gldg family protein, partial [Bacteroidales bacterium]